MKNAFNRCASSLLVVMLAAGGGVALTSLAQAQSSPGAAAAGAPPMEPRPPMGPGGLHGGREWMQLDRLKTSLKLDAGQTALWDQARDRMKPEADVREQMRTRRDRMAALLDDPNFDPRRLAAEMDAAEAERRAKRTAIRNAWFAVYDSLNPVQRGQVREFLRSRMSRHHGHHGGGMDGEHGHDGGPGGPPMPPGPPASR